MHIMHSGPFPTPALIRKVSDECSKSSLGAPINKRIHASVTKVLQKEPCRSVSFGSNEEREIEPIPSVYANDVYYSELEFKRFRRREKVAVRRAMANNKGSDMMDMESEDITWRGLERFLDGKDKRSKVKMHKRSVLQAQKQSGFSNAQHLRQVSKQLSRQDKCNALKRGGSDAEAAGYKVERTTVASTFRKWLALQGSLSSPQTAMTPVAA
jgi:hypothetical protein